jgi:hypothetical protein
MVWLFPIRNYRPSTAVPVRCWHRKKIRIVNEARGPIDAMRHRCHRPTRGRSPRAFYCPPDISSRGPSSSVPSTLDDSGSWRPPWRLGQRSRAACRDDSSRRCFGPAGAMAAGIASVKVLQDSGLVMDMSNAAAAGARFGVSVSAAARPAETIQAVGALDRPGLWRRASRL